MFIMSQRGGFARGAHRHQTMAAFGDLPFHMRGKAIQIHRAIFERGDQRRH